MLAKKFMLVSREVKSYVEQLVVNENGQSHLICHGRSIEEGMVTTPFIEYGQTTRWLFVLPSRPFVSSTDFR